MSDWTSDGTRSNSSPEFLALIDRLAGLIRSEAHALIGGQTKTVARLIAAQIAHAEPRFVPASELHRLREGLERTSGIAFALIEFDHILSDSDRPERTWLTDSMTPAEIAGALWDIHTIARDALTHGAIE